MKTLNRHLNSLLILLLAVSFNSCDKEVKQQNPDDKIVVSAGKLKLTRSELKAIGLDEKNKLKSREELVKSWIDREVLYSEAVADSLIYLPEYKEIVEQSKKEIAAAFYLRTRLKEFVGDITSGDIENFYDIHSEEFRLTDNSYFIKRADFDSYDEARSFRKNIFRKGWKRAVELVNKTENNSFSEELIAEHLIIPVKLQRLVKNLLNDEVSIILQTEPNRYSVVQLSRKFYKNQIPDLQYIYSKVKNRLIMIEKKKFVNELINDLYIKYKVESFEDSL
ncbi:MAG: hypothetical protein ACEPO8_10825 [Rhodothermaceae bacterium]